MNPLYEEEIDRILKEARMRVVEVRKKEKSDELRKARHELSQLYENAQDLPEHEFRKLCKKADKVEMNLSQKLQRETQRKICVHQKRDIYLQEMLKIEAVLLQKSEEDTTKLEKKKRDNMNEKER